jgi:hypothetical protein
MSRFMSRGVALLDGNLANLGDPKEGGYPWVAVRVRKGHAGIIPEYSTSNSSYPFSFMIMVLEKQRQANLLDL